MQKLKKLNKISTAWLLAYIAAILAWTPSATVSAQSFSSGFTIAYESALLDTALLYQKLKPLHRTLERAYEQLRQENQALRSELHFSSLHQRLQAEHYETRLRTAAHHLSKARWQGRLEGFLLGVFVPIP